MYVIFFVITNIIGVKDNVADAIIGNVNFLRVGINQMNKLQRKALWIEFKSDIQEYGFLNALNRLSFEVVYLKTVALSPEREILYLKYKLRKAKIHKLRQMLKLRD